MKPDDLHRYITEHMRMSHVYQPVMLRELLKSDGAATVEPLVQLGGDWCFVSAFAPQTLFCLCP